MAEDAPGLDALAVLGLRGAIDRPLGQVTRLERKEGLEDAPLPKMAMTSLTRLRGGPGARRSRPEVRTSTARGRAGGRAPTRAARQGLAHAIQRLSSRTAGSAGCID